MAGKEDFNFDIEETYQKGNDYEELGKDADLNEYDLKKEMVQINFTISRELKDEMRRFCRKHDVKYIDILKRGYQLFKHDLNKM